VRDDVEELYDYDVLRALPKATVFIVRSSQPTLVLGGSQSLEVLHEERRTQFALRRRRGGGGLVLLQPDDVWIDWWIPADDDRWSPDVHVTSRRVGEIWREALQPRIDAVAVVYEGSLVGPPELRVACFAGRGPGEVFVDDRKAVGLTQWRVREGVFVSTVMHAHSSQGLIDALREVPNGLEDALGHHHTASLGVHGDDVTADLVERSLPADVRQLFLMA
jgi:lipoate---protein ligase